MFGIKLCCPFEDKGFVIITISLVSLIKNPLKLDWDKLCSEFFNFEFNNVLFLIIKKMVIIFCDFSYLTAHTDSEGESEEEKRCMKQPDAMVKSEDEDLFNFLQKVDNLHKGSEDDKKEGFRLLLEKDDKVLWVNLILCCY